MAKGDLILASGRGLEAPQEPDWRAIGAREGAAQNSSRSFHLRLGTTATAELWAETLARGS